MSKSVMQYLLIGALAGLISGFTVGAAFYSIGLLPGLEGVISTNSITASLTVHFVVSAVLGAIFGLLVMSLRASSSGVIFWGVIFGVFWWFFGPRTMVSLLSTGTLSWGAAAASNGIGEFIGHIVYGAVTAMAFMLLKWQDYRQGLATDIWTLLTGALSGAIGGHMINDLLKVQGRLDALTTFTGGGASIPAPTLLLIVSILCGLLFAVFFPDSRRSSGVSLIRGLVFGLLLWALLQLTIVPTLMGQQIIWNINAVPGLFTTLPAYLLLGSFVALIYSFLSWLRHLLFVEERHQSQRGGLGGHAMGDLAWGLLAGLAGGLVFSLVLYHLDFFPRIARIVGGTTPLTGLIVHLIIALIIGASYGLFFRQQSHDAVSGLGWGVSYGVFWWLMGSLTLMPLLLGKAPIWNEAAARTAYPSLLGHIAYGATLGLLFYLLEARSAPWWVSRSQHQQQLVALRTEQLKSSGPALWVLVALLALILPLVF